MPRHSQNITVASSLQLAAVVAEDGVHQPPQRLRDRQPIGLAAHDVVGEPGQPELLPAVVAGFGHAVGVQQQPVTWFQLSTADFDGEVQVGAHRVRGWAVQRAAPPATAVEHGRVVTTVHPVQLAGGQIQVGQEARHVTGPAEVLDQRVLDPLAGGGQVHALTPGDLPAGGHGQITGQPGRAVVPHRVEHRQVQRVTGHGIVERIPAHGVDGFHGRGHHYPVAGERAWGGISAHCISAATFMAWVRASRA